MTVSGRLREINPPLPEQEQPLALEQGFLVQIGNSSFYITHFRDGEQICHTQEEWNTLFGSKISEFVQDLKKQNAGFDPDRMSELDIDLGGRVTYKTQSRGAAIALRTNRTALREFIHILRLAPGTPVDRSTISGTFAQNNSPLAEIAPNACTAIDLDFAAEAVQHEDGDFITSRLIDRTILKGQGKYAKMLPAIRRRMEEAGLSAREEGGVLTDFATINLETYYPLLQRGQMRTIGLTENTADDFSRMLEDKRSSDETPALFLGITNSLGNSYGIVIYKNQDQSLKEIVYFDSHSREEMNGTPNACAKRFRTIQEAAEFLARRNPYRAEGQNPNRNDITVTPFCFHYNLKEFFDAQAEDES